MSDAFTYSRKHQKQWNEARKLTCMYFDIIPMTGQITKEYIEIWLRNYGKTPEQMKLYLEELDLFWWCSNQNL